MNGTITGRCEVHRGMSSKWSECPAIAHGPRLWCVAPITVLWRMRVLFVTNVKGGGGRRGRGHPLSPPACGRGETRTIFASPLMGEAARLGSLLPSRSGEGEGAAGRGGAESPVGSIRRDHPHPTLPHRGGGLYGGHPQRGAFDRLRLSGGGAGTIGELSPPAPTGGSFRNRWPAARQWLRRPLRVP